MLPESLVAARKLLEEITPLQTDYGLVCGGACCQTHPGEETGMLLFPGEAEMYRGEKGFTLVDSPHGTILVCEGRCSRANRPLACRMFPLVMLLRPDGVKIATDAAAQSVCPLARQGKSALSQDFVAAVRQAANLLAQDDQQAAHLRRLTDMQDELKALRAQYRGRKEHV